MIALTPAYREIIRQEALSCYSKLPMSVRRLVGVEDLENDGIIQFYACQQKYKEGKASFATFLRLCLKRTFCNFLQREWRIFNRRMPLTEETKTVENIAGIDEVVSDRLTERERQIFWFLVEQAEKGKFRGCRKKIRKKFRLNDAECAKILAKIAGIVRGEGQGVMK